MNVSRMTAALAALATTTSALAASVIVPEDYGMGAFATIAAWQAAGAATDRTPVSTADAVMDYGVGAFATVAAYEQAGAARTARTVLATAQR